MDKRIERLNAMGCSTELALERMAYDEEFYIECLQEALENPCFEELAKALSADETENAFDCAHALKGVLGNVGITPMFNKAVEIVEPLRKGSKSSLDEELAELLKMRDEFLEIVS